MIFDPGAIEEAMVERLRADSTVAGWGGHVGSWPGPLAAARGAAEVIKLPAVLVVFLGGEIRRMGQFTFVADPGRFQVTVCARNFRRARSAQAPSAAGEVGAYEMANAVLRLFSGQTLNLDIDELCPTSVDLVDEARPGEVQYALVFETRFEFQMDDEAVDPAGSVTDLETVSAEIQAVDGENSVSVVTDTHEVG